MTTQAQVIVCPFCGVQAERQTFGWFAKPDGREQEFATVLHCASCNVYFSPLSLLAVTIRAMSCGKAV